MSEQKKAENWVYETQLKLNFQDFQSIKKKVNELAMKLRHNTMAMETLVSKNIILEQEILQLADHICVTEGTAWFEPNVLD